MSGRGRGRGRVGGGAGRGQQYSSRGGDSGGAGGRGRGGRTSPAYNVPVESDHPSLSAAAPSGIGGAGRRGRGGRTSPAYNVPVESDYPSLSAAAPSGSGGRGRGRGGSRTSPAYSVIPVESDYPSLPASAPSSVALSRELEQKLNIQSSASTSTASQPSSSSVSPAVQSSASTSTASQPSSSSASPAVQPLVQKHVPPASSKAIRIPPRPGFGTVGRGCKVRANHFLVELDPKKDIHHYDVSITPEIASKKVSKLIMKQLVSSYLQSHLGGHRLGYDGGKSVYAAGPLPFKAKEFIIKLSDENGAGRERAFQVSIKFAAKVDLHHLLQFLRRQQADAPHETIQALDVVLRESLSSDYVVVGRSFFSPELGAKGELGEGLEYWKGFYQSLRPTQMGLSLNIDISARPFYEPVLVTEFISKCLNIRDLTRPLSDQLCVKMKRALKGIIVQTSHLGYVKRQKVSLLTSEPLKQLKFPIEGTGTEGYVVQYFRERYNIVLKYTSLPAFQFGTVSSPKYLPMEICRITEGQRYTRKLNERQVSALLRATCQRPDARESNIKRTVENNNYNNDPLVRYEFGIQVRPELTSVNARVLQPPMLKYNETGGESRVDPRVGQWNMKNKKMVNGGRVDFWTCISFSRGGLAVADRFCEKLVSMCCNKGMVFSQSFLPFQTGDPRRIEQCLVNVHNQSIARFKSMGLAGKQLQLLIVILPDLTGSYGTIKRVCETKLGIVTQCCKPEQASKGNIQYLENVSLKINVKVGGRNTVLEQAVQRKIPFLTDVPTIVFGADVTHPAPGEDASPSIAAVVASMDWPEVTKYRGLVSAQHHRVEIIQDLYKKSEDPQKGIVHGGMIRELLLAFYQSTKQKPHRIIFYRDGVSEGQFNQVLLDEMDAIRQACASLQENYLPPVTFVVVQKRHHTRLFPSDRNLTDRSGNILPGTVVDTEICHPMEFDFYLCSHAGIQGTSRPTHYHVLFDENRFTADALQTLTNNLCYTYARCTRSVSIVPPAYYAHLAAFRARYYVEGETSDGGSSGPGRTSRESNVEVRSLPAIMDNVKDVMFYC